MINISSEALKCPSCEKGHMLPVEDNFSQNSPSVGVKGYVCSNPTCNNNIMFIRGQLTRMKIADEPDIKLR